MSSLTLREYFEELEHLISSNGSVNTQEYDSFWNSLVISPSSASHFVTILIAQYMYLLSGHYKVTTFPEFLLKTTSPASLQSGDMKVVDDGETNILFIFLGIWIGL